MVNDEFRADVVSRLVDAFKGMFLLARFYIEDLCEYLTTGAIHGTSDGIGSAIGNEDLLHETYGRVTDSIRAQYKSRSRLAVKALTWLLTADRTFTLDELRMAVAVDYNIKNRRRNPNLFNEAEMLGQS
ncbi:hypothetical protein DFP73DRAFT_524713 [Morchella snyderi]|nr:hypothetical protein DFP73DRAFT_524713 [Morchella snyderi]